MTDEILKPGLCGDADVFKALADSTRLQIITLLLKHKLCVHTIADLVSANPRSHTNCDLYNMDNIYDEETMLAFAEIPEYIVTYSQMIPGINYKMAPDVEVK